LLRGRRWFDAGHRAGVHVLAISEGVVAVGALYLEPKLLVVALMLGDAVRKLTGREARKRLRPREWKRCAGWRMRRPQGCCYRYCAGPAPVFFPASDWPRDFLLGRRPTHPLCGSRPVATSASISMTALEASHGIKIGQMADAASPAALLESSSRLALFVRREPTWHLRVGPATRNYPLGSRP
jgi:hypothetical protein